MSEPVTETYSDFTTIENAYRADPDAFARYVSQPFDTDSLAGNYLTSQFAQRHYDWEKASNDLDRVLEFDEHNTQLLSRAMILSMGAGQFDKAIGYAKTLVEIDPDNALAQLFIAINAFKDDDYQQALALVQAMPEGSLSEFMMPLLLSWAKAGIGEYDVENIQGNTIHLYHAVLIADFLKREEGIAALLERSLVAQSLTFKDIELLADMYAFTGQGDMALKMYKKVIEEWPENTRIAHKISALESGKQIAKDDYTFYPVSTAKDGAAQGLYDMSTLLFREQSDDSANVFVNMAYALNPEMSEAVMLIGHIAARNGQKDKAISYYRTIPQSDRHYLEASRMAANLLEDMERDEEALSVLKKLYQDRQDVDALVQIGDIYRRNEDFPKAIESYNEAERVLGGITKERWQILYLRGMAYERNKQWLKAEKDLKAAMEYQPEQAMVLNYLGYSWADQGLNLKEALSLIKKAAELQPQDAYIIDSLGWVLYKMGRYEEAVPHLEEAVELLPYDGIINDHLGDAYWRVGRKMEARFQWLRAKNYAGPEDEELKQSTAEKLQNGLGAKNIRVVEEAKKQDDEFDTNKTP